MTATPAFRMTAAPSTNLAESLRPYAIFLCNYGAMLTGSTEHMTPSTLLADVEVSSILYKFYPRGVAGLE